MSSLRFVTLALISSSVFSIVAAQPDSTFRPRRADSIMTFFVGAWGPFDDTWSQVPSEQHFGSLGDPDRPRFINLDDSLGLNGEIRKFWDYPASRFPAHPDTVLGGKRGPHLDVLGIEPLQLYYAFDNAAYLRFEFERHTKQTAPTEYLGFLHRTGLTGKNVIAEGATLPSYLAGTSRETDTNAIELTASDAAGVFADSMWHDELYSNNTYSHANLIFGYRSRKMIARLRVKITEDVADTNTILCIVKRTESRRGAIRKVGVDTIKVNSKFKHVNRGFDTIDIPFIRDIAYENDSVENIFFSFYWPKQVRAIFDYMELLTARIVSTDLIDSVNVGGGNIGTDGILNGLFTAYSAEDFLDSVPVELGKLISIIKQRYLGRINYVRIGDEFPFANALPFKRLVKLMRDSTQGRIEIVPFTVDSGTGWIGQSLPNTHEYAFEGVRKGWLDSSKYADPKMIFFDPYSIRQTIPLPIRTTDHANLQQWEKTFAPSLAQPHYTRDKYIRESVQNHIFHYLQFNRTDRRWTERQGNGTRYGILWQAGAHLLLENGKMKYNSLRPPTGPEMKVTGHLATSCGASALIFYLLSNPRPGQGGHNGGIMMSDGRHDSMYYTTHIAHDTGRFWMGFQERYDTVRQLIPLLTTYGTTLLNAKRLGDWTASEMPLLPQTTKDNLPFHYNSIRASDDNFLIDAFRQDLAPGTLNFANRTFVHIALWLDTLNGRSDTMLYITNMRSDDSYATTAAVPSTIDRRTISLQLKRSFKIIDVFNPGDTLGTGKIRTPVVAAGGDLKVSLLAGDGILLKLDTNYNPPPAPKLPDQLYFSIVPNPTFTYTQFYFQLPSSSSVRITIYDILGKKIGTISEDRSFPAGWGSVGYDASALAKGTYYVKLEAASLTSIVRMLVF